MQESELNQTGTMGRIILSAIARGGDLPAIGDDWRTLSYRALGEEIARAVAVLRGAGLCRDAGIAVLSRNRIELMVVEFAAMLIGARYTPLHPMAAADTHAFVVAHAEAMVLVVDPQALRYSLEQLRGVDSPVTRVFAFGALDGAVDLLDSMGRTAPALLRDDANPGDLVRLLYTGGTTGKPKGVMHPHRTMATATVLQAVEWELPPRPRFLAVTAVSHASGAIVPTVLMQGGYVRLTDGFDVDRFCQIVAAERIDTTFLVPTMIYVLLDHPGVTAVDLSSLKTIVYGASPMVPDRMVAALDRFGTVFVQLYGQTEIPNCITTLRKADHAIGYPERLKSCGLPSPLTQVTLRDADGTPVVDGVPGEIWVRSPLVTQGYWKDPEATAKAFVDSWMHTGDIAVRSPDGFIAIVDRTSDLIISGGFNVYPREVEDALHAHPAVAMAAVVGRPDAKWGEAVTAFVTLRPNHIVGAEALKAHVRALRGAVWTPKAVHFVDAIPMTALGKIDRKALRRGDSG